jgi:hypothetical protein
MNRESIQIQDSLRQRLDEAQVAYRSAYDEYKRLMAISADTSSLDNPALCDGLHALSRAMQIHQHARLAYEPALKAFNDFILDGKRPPADPDR